MAWKLEDWGATIEQIVQDIQAAPNRTHERKVFRDWRSRLEQAPAFLLPYQIDMIMREVQRRLKGA